MIVFAHQWQSNIALSFEAIHFFVDDFIFFILAKEDLYVCSLG
jgi:hypothetical protein